MIRRRRTVAPALLMAVFVAMAEATATVAQTTRLGIVTSITGSAALERSPARASAMNTKDEVVPGDRITTGVRSEATIVLAGRAQLTMYASAAVRVTGGTARFVLTVEKGLITYTMADTEEVQQIATPNTSLRLVGAIAFITVATGRVRDTAVCAQRGSINAAVVGGGAVMVEQGQCVSIVDDRIGPIHPMFPSPPPPGADTGSIVPVPRQATAWRCSSRSRVAPREVRPTGRPCIV